MNSTNKVHERRSRVLVAKLGLDGHDVGAKVISRRLRDAGLEVVYLGIRQTPESVAATAIQEDVDLVGISMLSGSHLTLVPKLLAALNQGLSLESVPVIVGGVIPGADRTALLEEGVSAIFDASDAIDTVVGAVKDLADRHWELTKVWGAESPSNSIRGT